VFEAGSGTINGVDFVAGTGADNVKGLENNSNGFFYPLAGLTQPEVAIVSMGAGMDALDGGWPILFGPDPVTSSGVTLVIDEDQTASTERRHSTESVPYVVFEGGPSNVAPTAIALADNSQGTLSLTVNFDASASFDIDGSIVSYAWNLGDGSTASGITTSATYGPGNFEVVLTVTDDLGATDTDTVQISVEGPNQAPVASFTATPTPAQIGQAVGFDASGSTDSDGSIVSYAWNFDDLGNAATGISPSYTFSDTGWYAVELTVTDDDGAIGVFVENVRVDTIPVASGIKFETGVLTNVGDAWQTVPLSFSYTNMVVVTTPLLSSGSQLPVVTRIDNASGNSFDLRVQGFSGNVPAGYAVHYLVVEAGTYTLANDGVQMEAGTFTSTLTAGVGNWSTEARSYQQAYSLPVVLGQVMSYNDPNWSVFWANGSGRGDSPTDLDFNAGKNVGEDPNTVRANETLGYVVFETGNGTLNGTAFDAGVGSDIVKALENSANGYLYPLNGLSNPEVAIVSMGGGMDALDGGWPILFGSNPVNSTGLNLLIDEDQVVNTERRHSTESVAFVAFEGLSPRLRKPGSLAISVFPNPFSDHVQVQIAGQLKEEVQVELYNAVGQLLKVESFDKANFTMMLEQALPDGVYLLRVKAGETELMKRLVKTN
jgi:PKD repeat protein